jgi:uncharacterized protein YbjT (DUF2867 family)
VARILIVGGGCRGRQLASALVADGHAVRITTRTEAGRPAIEAGGAECWIGTPDRLATLRAALEGVTVLCWLLGSATGPLRELHALHSTRLEFFATQAIDTTVRGFIYEARGTTTPADALRGGMVLLRAVAERNAIPLAFLTADPNDAGAWLAQSRAAVDSLLIGA